MVFALIAMLLAQPPKLPPLTCAKGEKLQKRESEHQRFESCVRNQWSPRGRSFDEQGRLRSQWSVTDAGEKYTEEFLENGQRVARWQDGFVSTLESVWWPASCQRIARRGGDEIYLPKCAAACDGVDGGARVVVVPPRFARMLDLRPHAHEGLSFEVSSFQDGGSRVCASSGRCEVVTGALAFVTPDGAGLLAFFESSDGGFPGRFDAHDGGVQRFVDFETKSSWVGATQFLVGESQRLVDGLTGKTLIASTPCDGLANLLDDGSVLCTDRSFVWTRTWATHSARCPEAKLNSLWRTDYGPQVFRLAAPHTPGCDDVFRGLVECAPGLDE